MDFAMDGSGKPYEQVAASLTRRIAVGEWQVGDQLPTNRELAESYGVAANTIGNAIGVLRDEGLVFSQQGRGTFVRALPVGIEASEPSAEFAVVIERLDQVQDEMRALASRLARLEDAAGVVEPSAAAPQES